MTRLITQTTGISNADLSPPVRQDTSGTHAVSIKPQCGTNADRIASKSIENRDYYLNHRERFLDQIKARHKELQDLARACGCEVCDTKEGKFNWHHVDPDTKKFTLSEGVRRNKAARHEEMRKCIPLCTSCHMIEHSWLRYMAKVRKGYER